MVSLLSCEEILLNILQFFSFAKKITRLSLRFRKRKAKKKEMKTNQEIAIKQRILLQRKKQKRNQAKKIQELRNRIKKMKTMKTHQVRCQKKMNQKKMLLERICQPVTREFFCYIWRTLVFFCFFFFFCFQMRSIVRFLAFHRVPLLTV